MEIKRNGLTVANLYKFQKLKTKLGDYAILLRFDNKKITVRYKNRIIDRPLSAIGTTLFPVYEKTRQQPLYKKKTPIIPKKPKASYVIGSSQSRTTSKDSDKVLTCENCMQKRSGNCFGDSKICEDFKQAPSISNEQIETRPKYGDASYFKFVKRYRKKP